MSSSSIVDAVAPKALAGRRITISGRFLCPVRLESVEDLGNVVLLRARVADGIGDATRLGVDELLSGAAQAVDEGAHLNSARTHNPSIDPSERTAT